jgi:hypothetical protein
LNRKLGILVLLALAIDEPDVKCIGYWNKLDDYHQFSFGGSLKQE